MDELATLFLYRLSYVDKNGLPAAKKELCPWGSGRKFKRCYLDDVKALKSALGHQLR